MNLFGALFYFAREATLSLLRSWKVGILAIVTIAVSLYVGGTVLLISGNLAELVERWRGQHRVVVYLRGQLGEPAVERIRVALAGRPGVIGVEAVSSQAAAERFATTFPGLADLLAGWGDDALPASFEVSVDPVRLPPAARTAWVAELRLDPAVTMVDDDHDWLAELETAVALLRAVGLGVGLVLLAAAIFTIASVIRLTAYLYRDEIAIMRLVGATEFFIRGPFYFEGMLQGLLGGLLALGALYGSWRLVVPRSPLSLSASLVSLRFLTPGEMAALALLAAGAGLLGAVASLRRETLGTTAAPPPE